MQPADSDSDSEQDLMLKLVRQIKEDWTAEKRCQVQSTPPELWSTDFDTTYSDEVRDLMYVYGDVRSPNWFAALTLLRHLRIYINNLLANANRIANMRGDNSLEPASVLFQLRKNKEKLGRLIKYMKIKDYKSRMDKRFNEHNPEISDDGPRVNDCVKFLLEIFTPREVNEICDQMDPLSERRLQRNDCRTQNMSTQEYMQFSTKQQCSFIKDGISFFGNWLLTGHPISLKPTTRSLEIINFLLRDFIAEVVDEVLLERERSKDLPSSSSSSKPLQSKPSPSLSNRLSGLKDTTIKKKSDNPPSLISEICKSYNIDVSQSLKYLQEEDAAIKLEEINSAVHKLKDICSPFVVKANITNNLIQAITNKAGPSSSNDMEVRLPKQLPKK